jgi:hypothetical protein
MGFGLWRFLEGGIVPQCAPPRPSEAGLMQLLTIARQFGPGPLAVLAALTKNPENARRAETFFASD